MVALAADIGHLTRPRPPEELRDALRLPEIFAPAPELDAWARAAFLTRGAPLYNKDHEHLLWAKIGWLWTNVENKSRSYDAKGLRRLVGASAWFVNLKGSPWTKGMAQYQLVQWFRQVPDFVITVDAVLATRVGDLSWCGLIEHELYHCGQARDRWGAPRFTKKTGLPVFCARGHGAEEHPEVVRRYGLGAAAAGVRDLVAAALQEPEVGAADVSLACGTCDCKVA
jgi:hypothetical protein